MVAVGDEDRLRAHEGADLALAGRIVLDPQRVGHALVVGQLLELVADSVVDPDVQNSHLSLLSYSMTLSVAPSYNIARRLACGG